MHADRPERPAIPELAGAEELLQLQVTALEAAANPILISRRDGTIIWVNKAFEQLSGYTRGEALGQSTSLLKSGQQAPPFFSNMWETILAGQKWRGELVNRRKDGSLYQEEMTITPVKNAAGDITHFIAIKLDITERKLAEEQIRQLALTDPLTGLANYRRLFDALDSEIKRCARTGRSFAVLLLDLDGLKKINDDHGHQVGSRALCRVANFLRIHCRAIDTAARYGGDEFVVVLPETGCEAARLVAQRISEESRNEGEEPSISVGVGAAIFPQDGKTIDELLAAADRALYREKRSPKRRSTAENASHSDD
ncbi:MAG: diguanylate cyclase [Candidatus Acidiferrum sp.]|jgi:diguanylate cyclase (GGDEF)-like protein/PAS domain S-box-containing protein